MRDRAAGRERELMKGFRGGGIRVFFFQRGFFFFREEANWERKGEGAEIGRAHV